jgi:puromycin-sensitive aminopeptidase
VQVAEAGPVVVNAGGWGFFRVAYDDALTARNADSLSSFSEIERYNLVSDAWAATLAGAASVDTVLDLLARYKDETDPATWALLAEICGVLARVHPNEGVRAFVRDLAGTAAARLGWTGTTSEPATHGIVRGTVLELLGVVGRDAEVIAEAARRVNAAHDGDAAALTGVIRRASLQTFGRTADEAGFQTLLDGMRAATTPQDEQQFRFALASVGHEALARRTCDLCTTEIRSQDVAIVLVYLMMGPQQAVVWDWIEAHWAELQERLPANLHARSLQGVQTVTDADLAKRIRTFLEDGNLPAVGAKTVTQYLELMDTTVRFAARAHDTLTARFGS